MSCYIIAGIAIHDRDKYQKCPDGFDEIFSQYLGIVVAIDMDSEVLKGKWPFECNVLIRIPQPGGSPELVSVAGISAAGTAPQKRLGCQYRDDREVKITGISSLLNQSGGENIDGIEEIICPALAAV